MLPVLFADSVCWFMNMLYASVCSMLDHSVGFCFLLLLNGNGFKFLFYLNQLISVTVKHSSCMKLIYAACSVCWNLEIIFDSLCCLFCLLEIVFDSLCCLFCLLESGNSF
ncbi:hypothetical protein S83_052418 [Arachis hypogaea]